jgi:hypothetical protein
LLNPTNEGWKMVFWSGSEDEEEVTTTPESEKDVEDARAREAVIARSHGQYASFDNPHNKS